MKQNLRKRNLIAYSVIMFLIVAPFVSSYAANEDDAKILVDFTKRVKSNTAPSVNRVDVPDSQYLDESFPSSAVQIIGQKRKSRARPSNENNDSVKNVDPVFILIQDCKTLQGAQDLLTEKLENKEISYFDVMHDYRKAIIQKSWDNEVNDLHDENDCETFNELKIMADELRKGETSILLHNDEDYQYKPDDIVRFSVLYGLEYNFHPKKIMNLFYPAGPEILSIFNDVIDSPAFCEKHSFKMDGFKEEIIQKSMEEIKLLINERLQTGSLNLSSTKKIYSHLKGTDQGIVYSALNNYHRLNICYLIQLITTHMEKNPDFVKDTKLSMIIRKALIMFAITHNLNPSTVCNQVYYYNKDAKRYFRSALLGKKRVALRCHGKLISYELSEKIAKVNNIIRDCKNFKSARDMLIIKLQRREIYPSVLMSAYKRSIETRGWGDQILRLPDEEENQFKEIAVGLRSGKFLSVLYNGKKFAPEHKDYCFLACLYAMKNNFNINAVFRLIRGRSLKDVSKYTGSAPSQEYDLKDPVDVGNHDENDEDSIVKFSYLLMEMRAQI